MLKIILGGVAFLFLGLVFFIKPTVIWKITEQWKSNCAEEPSKLYIINVKIEGGIFILLGIVMMVAGCMV